MVRETTLREAGTEDAAVLAATVAEGFASYLDWAPPGWEPPAVDEASLGRLVARLRRADVWCVLALVDGRPAGHVALSPVTTEDPGPLPAGQVFLWQMFVREPWRGHGVASTLMARAVAEATGRGFTAMRLWTPEGAARARRFYEREGWAPTGRRHEVSPSGLPTVEYGRALRSS